MRSSSLQCCLALTGLLGVALASPRSPDTSLTDKLRDVLARPLGDARTREQVVEQLVRMGPDAIPDLFGTYTGEKVEEIIGTEPFVTERWWCAPDEFGALSLEALGDMPAQKLVAYLKNRAQPEAPIEMQLACMRVLGELGSAQGLPLLFNTANRQGPKALLYRSVATTFEDSLGAILSKDKSAFPVVESHKDELAPELLALAVEATRKADRPEGVRFLLSVLGKDVQLDVAALEAASDLARRFPWRTAVDPRRQVRDRLRDGNPEVRRAAAIATGRIRDTEAFDALVLMLEDVDPRVVRAAQWSLEYMTGETQLELAEQWQRWSELEERWWTTEGTRLRSELKTGDPRRVSSAARALAERTFHTDEVALYICDVLPQQMPACVADLCQVLTQLESPTAVPLLVDLLFDPTPRIRNAAGNALKRITGRSLPAEPWIWEKYANG